VVDVLPDLALVAHHADHRVGDAGVLRRLALVRPAADLAILAAHRRGRAIGAQVRFLAACLQGTILLGLRVLRLKWKTNSKLGANRPCQSPGMPGP
jgi:hypothetical protein